MRISGVCIAWGRQNWPIVHSDTSLPNCCTCAFSGDAGLSRTSIETLMQWAARGPWGTKTGWNSYRHMACCEDPQMRMNLWNEERVSIRLNWPGFPLASAASANRRVLASLHARRRPRGRWRMCSGCYIGCHPFWYEPPVPAGESEQVSMVENSHLVGAGMDPWHLHVDKDV